ncbi:MAG: tetratricopeptide repeat protein [Polyangiaceae bacterium]
MTTQRLLPLLPLTLGLTLGCGAAQAQPAKAPAAKSTAKPSANPAKNLQDGETALRESRYADAEKLLQAAARGKQRGRALTLLAEVQLQTGRYEDAHKTVMSVMGVKDAKADAAVIGGEALRRQGKLDEAAALLQRVTSEPEARRARLLLGEVLLEKGDESGANTQLMTLVEDYNSDNIKETDGPGLAMVGRAAALLRSPRDANDAFNQSERAEKFNVQTLLWRAELFLDKYDPGHAEEVTKEVLEKAPNHPDALVWMAHVKLAQALDFDEAERLAKKALAINPRLAQAHFVLAGIALRDMELGAAEKHVSDGLQHNARDLDLLSMRAAAKFLADDSAGFDRTIGEVLKLNPKYSRAYQIVGEYADWEHRYDEIVAMMRKAVQIDSDDAKAYAQLGLNLIRAGDDKGGVQALSTAFDKDPFNVRVYNTLNLYEKTIPRDYVSVPGKIFNYRYHKDEKAILERYVPGLMEQAWRKMTKSYDFVPKTPVGVELYAERQNFAIRTSGLPGTAIQGVCFGSTLASMSPKEEKFNLGMTVWHELAHVFHIQMSKAHVPRWFTEGLAEYETLVERPEWSREHDPALYEALRSQRLPQVGSMSRAFTRAEEMSDVATAYYASSQIMTMLMQKYGAPKANAMLKGWGDGKRTEQVVSAALGKSAADLDAEFRAWAKTKLARYETQFVPMGRTGGYERAKEEAAKAPKDAEKQTRYALAALRAGKAEEASKALDAALAIDAEYPDALYIRARLQMGQRQASAAQATLERLAKKRDGYVVQMALADVYEASRNLAKMKAAFEAAHRLDPTQAEPMQALVDLAKKQGDAATELTYLRKLAALEEHDGRVFRRLMRALIDKKEYKEAKDVGEQALWADIEGMETHATFAEALVHLKMIPRAIFELESALLCPGRPSAKAKVHEQLSKAYKLVPNAKKAAEHAALAKKLAAVKEKK